MTYERLAKICAVGIQLDGGIDIDSIEEYFVRVEQAAFEMAANEADAAGLERPENRRKDDPRATYQAGACRAAWRIRELARERSKT